MFRLVDDAFSDNKELHTLAGYCLTETIKHHLEMYFEEDYQLESDDLLYTKVKIDKVFGLFDNEFLEEMQITGINVSSFISKKMAQFMQILKKQEEITPDIFIEYILSRMIRKSRECRIEFIHIEVDSKKDELKNLLRSYAKNELGINDIKERNLYVKENILVLTSFSYLSGVDGYDDTSLTFWDLDFSFFDDWGFIKMLEQLSFGVLNKCRGEYGLDYTRSIFYSVSDEGPYILT